MRQDHNTTADGALHVTLLDLIAWERMVRTRALLSAESWSKIFQPATLLNGRKTSYGFAWELERQGGKDIHYHDGSWQGFETLLIGTLTTTCRSLFSPICCRCRIETTRRQNRSDRKRRGIAERVTPPRLRASRVPVGALHSLDHDPVSAYPSRRGRKPGTSPLLRAP